MNNKFDELTKSLAQSVTRRAALKKFGLSLAGMALACLGLANKAEAGPRDSGCGCVADTDCGSTSFCQGGVCLPKWCDTSVNSCCCYRTGKMTKQGKTAWPQCSDAYGYCASYCA